jgi:hypothetical protein
MWRVFEEYVDKGIIERVSRSALSSQGERPFILTPPVWRFEFQIDE